MAIKKSLKVILILISVFILIVISASAYLLFNARQILLAEVEKNLGIKIQMSNLRIALPASIIIDNLAVEDKIRIRKITVSPSLLGFIKGDIAFNSISLENPWFNVTRHEDENIDLGIAVYKKSLGVEAPETPSATKEETKIRQQPKKLSLNRLKIRDAEIEYIDQAVSAQQPFRIKLSNFDLDFSKASLLQVSRMQFKGHGDLVSQNGQRIGQLDSSGWLDISARDMDAQLSMADVSLPYLGPYFEKYLKLRKEIKSGDMALTGNLKSDNNNLKIDCHVELANVAFKEPQQEQQASTETDVNVMDLTSFALESVLSTQGKAVFDFSVNTKMDNPKFENVKFRGTFLQAKMEDIVSKPPQETIEDFKKIGEQFKDIGKEFKKIFKGE